MSLEALLVHRLEVRRRAPGLDRGGQPLERFDIVATAVPCRLTRPRGGERNSERMRQTYGVQHRLFLAEGADVTEDDRVTVTDGDGSVLLAGARVDLKRLQYGASGQAPHHLELDLEALRGPQ